MAITTTEMTETVEALRGEDLYAKLTALRINGSDKGNTIHAASCGMVKRFRSYAALVLQAQSHFNGPDDGFYKVHSCLSRQRETLTEATKAGMESRSSKMDEARAKALAEGEAALVAAVESYREVCPEGAFYAVEHLSHMAAVVDAARAAGREI